MDDRPLTSDHALTATVLDGFLAHMDNEVDWPKHRDTIGKYLGGGKLIEDMAGLAMGT